MDLQEIFRKMCFIRYFELEVAEAYKKKLIPWLVYLSVSLASPFVFSAI